MERLGRVARDAVEPALLKVYGSSIVASIQRRFEEVQDDSDRAEESDEATAGDDEAVESETGAGQPPAKSRTVTTEEELEVYRIVHQICTQAGYDPDDILYRDTVSYFNVSFKRPTKWFLRFFGDSKRKAVVTIVPVDEARELAAGFEVQEAPSAFGVSRVYVEEGAQLWALDRLVLRSLELLAGLPARPQE